MNPALLSCAHGHRLKDSGTPPKHGLLVANHLSYLDILVFRDGAAVLPRLQGRRSAAGRFSARWPAPAARSLSTAPAASAPSGTSRSPSASRARFPSCSSPKAPAPTAASCCAFTPASTRPPSKRASDNDRGHSLYPRQTARRRATVLVRRRRVFASRLEDTGRSRLLLRIDIRRAPHLR